MNRKGALPGIWPRQGSLPAIPDGEMKKLRCFFGKGQNNAGHVDACRGIRALLNLLGLCLMAFDKLRARRGGHRIRERTLFLVAALGGSIGCWAGMYLFRHKTKHRAFVVGIPAILAVQLLLVGWAAPQIANRL